MIGRWLDEGPEATSVIEGKHEPNLLPVGGEDAGWTCHVRAASSDLAARKAVAAIKCPAGDPRHCDEYLDETCPTCNEQ